MNNLLSRLEALTGPSREVDAEIALANGWVKENPDWEKRGILPRYTKSLDAVLPLAPVLDGPRRGLWIRLNETVGAHGTSHCLWHAQIWGLDDLAPFRTDSCDHNHSAKTQLRYPQNMAKKIVDLMRAYKMMCDSVAGATIGANRFRSHLKER